MEHEFNKWMLKIGNIYYADNDKMALAFEKLISNEKV